MIFSRKRVLRDSLARAVSVAVICVATTQSAVPQTKVDLDNARLLAFKLVAAGQYDSAAELARTILQGAPNDQAALLALAQGLHLKGHQVIVVCDNSTLKSVHAAQLAPLCLPAHYKLDNVFDPATTRLNPDEEKAWDEIENPPST